MVEVASGKKREPAGGWPSVCSPTDIALRQTKRVPTGYPTEENSFIYIEDEFHLCMDIHMHGFPTRLIFFINMLIQVQALQSTDMDSRDYII